MTDEDIASKNKYCELILEQIKLDMEISDTRIKHITNKLRQSSLCDLERLYQAFERFGVSNIIENI